MTFSRDPRCREYGHLFENCKHDEECDVLCSVRVCVDCDAITEGMIIE